MPITESLDELHRLIRIAVDGPFTASDITAAIPRIAALAAARPDYALLSDHRTIAAPATPHDVDVFVAQAMRHRSALKDRRCAIITASRASFGMMRMLATYADRVPIHIQVFSDADEAEAWLAGSPAGQE